MNTIIEMLPDRPMTSAEVVKAIKKDKRTVQDFARAQILKATMQKRPEGGKQWMFDPESVREYLRNPGQLRPKAETKAVAVRSKIAAVAQPKLGKGEHELNVPHLLGNLMAAHMKEQEAFLKAQDVFLKQLDVQANNAAKNLENITATMAKNLENIVDKIFEDRRSDRDDSFRRFDAERRDRAERLQYRRDPTPPEAGKPNGKAKGARA